MTVSTCLDKKLTVLGAFYGSSMHTITASGSHARIPAHVEELIAGRSETGTIDAHAVQPLYTGMVAKAAGMAIAFGIEGDTVTITATKAE